MRPIDADWFKELVLSKKETDPYIVGVMINAIDAMPTVNEDDLKEYEEQTSDMGRTDHDTKGTSNKMP